MFRIVGEKFEGNKGVLFMQVFFIFVVFWVGIGNLIGVVLVIVIGGSGVVFWMWVVVVVGMVLSFVESMLVQFYKVKDGNDFCGGLVYYI